MQPSILKELPKKRTVLILLFGLLYTTLSYGQIKRFEVGVEGGLGPTFIRGNSKPPAYSDPKIGFTGGFTFQFNLPNIVSLRSGLSYDRKGASEKITETDNTGVITGEFSVDRNFDYLTIPVLARISFGKRFKFFTNLGPYIGILLRQTTVIEEHTGFPGETTDDTHNFKRFDIGMSAGIGGGFPVNDRFMITIEARYNLGLYNVSKVPLSNNGSILTNSTNLIIGVAYCFGNRGEESE